MADRAERQMSAQQASAAGSADPAARRARLSRYRRHRRRVLLFVIALSLALGYLAFRFGFELVRVDGAGMSPTLEAGSTVLCVKQDLLDRLAGIVPEDARRIGRNDLVLIDYHAVNSEGARAALLVKRVVGLDGDEIDAGGGEFIVNRETVAGEVATSDLVYPVTVPGGYMFVVGDNRALSVDSRQRAFGMVAEADVIARPVAVIWPLYAAGLVK